MDKNWSLYCGKHKNTLQSYIGVHDGDITDGEYGTSSKNPFLKDAIKKQLIEFKTITFGSKEEMYNYEYYFLSKYDAKNNTQFFNRSNGGGPGIDKTFKPNPDIEKRLCNLIENNIWEDPNTDLLNEVSKTDSKRMRALWNKVKKSSENWKTGGTKEFPIEEISVNELYIVDHSQARAVKLIQSKLSELIKAFKNLGYARNNITPVIVVVKDGKIIMLIDGNHRINAAHTAGWDTYPVIKIDFSEFNGDEYLIDYFGRLMNHVEVQRTGNDIDTLVISLRQLHKKFSKYKIDSTEFIVIAKHEYGGKNTKDGGMYLNSDVVRKCIDLAKIDKEMKVRETSEKNFIDYTSARLATLWYHSSLFNDHKVIFQSLDGINNGGLGGAIGYAVDNFIENGINEANLVIHFKSLTGYLTEAKDSVEKLRTTLQHGVKSKINIFFADPFKEQIVTTLNGLPTTTK
jgi:hypothetical protein